MKILNLTDFLSKKTRKINEGAGSAYNITINDIKFNGIQKCKLLKYTLINEIKYPIFQVKFNPCEMEYWETNDYYVSGTSKGFIGKNGDVIWDSYISKNSLKISDMVLNIDMSDYIWNDDIDETEFTYNRLVSYCENVIPKLFRQKGYFSLKINCGGGYVHSFFEKDRYDIIEDSVEIPETFEYSVLPIVGGYIKSKMFLDIDKFYNNVDKFFDE